MPSARSCRLRTQANHHGICGAWASIDHLRSLVTARIHSSLPGERGEIAAALITDERAGISEEDNQAMRNSGLFDILSISGLHMVIMADTVSG